MEGGPQIQIQVPPGAPPPTPEQIAQIQRQITEEAAKAGISVQEYVHRLQQEAMRQQMAMQQQQGGHAHQHPHHDHDHDHDHDHGHGHEHGHEQQTPAGATQIPLDGGAPPPKPEALAVAQFLRSQDLKPRVSLFNNERKDMFRVKRAIRALESPAYQKARGKNALLPEVNDRVTAENTFKLLPMSLLALRVSKIDAHEGHDHAPPKKIKGQWTVKVEQHQEAHDDMYYIWLYEGSQWKTKLYAGGALALILAVVFFPVWPYKLRLGVWYLSMGALGLLGLFFAMAIFRLILFIVTMFAAAPGLWLYPNLFEDVGFFDSFRPVWAWQETKESRKLARAGKREKKAARDQRRAAKAAGFQPGHVEQIEVGDGEEAGEDESQGGSTVASSVVDAQAGSSGADVGGGTMVTRRPPRPTTMEEVADDDD